MLIGIDPRMTPPLMDALMRMGHGDEIAVVDANFPADSIAATTEPRPYGCFILKKGVVL